MKMALIHPPLSRPCEPPAGIARLAGALKQHSGRCLILDMNMECLAYLLSSSVNTEDTWTRRAWLHLEDNLSSIRSGAAFNNMGSYTKAVTEISRILEMASKGYSTYLSLNNFQHATLSPVRSADLLFSAEHPEVNVFYPYFKKRFISVLEDHRPGCFGFSLNYLSQALTTFAMIGLLRKLDHGVKIILGGGLINSWMNRPDWNDPFPGLVDQLVSGPGEGCILSIVGLEGGCTGILPDYEPFWHYNYLSPARVVPFSTSDGCYWGKCSFCPEKAEGNPYRPMAAMQVIEGLDSITDLSLPGLVHMIDNAMSPSLLKAMACHSFKAPWYGFARITHHLADPGFCRALAGSGCMMLQLGLESGDQSVLDALDKGIRLDEAHAVFESLHSAGIATYVYLLFGTPEEDEASARMTMDYVTAHAGCIDFLNLSIFNLPKGCNEAVSLKTYDFSDGDLSLYQGFVHPKGWERNRVRQFLDKVFKRHPAIARIMRNDPPYFTSNHAPFFIRKALHR